MESINSSLCKFKVGDIVTRITTDDSNGEVFKIDAIERMAGSGWFAVEEFSNGRSYTHENWIRLANPVEIYKYQYEQDMKKLPKSIQDQIINQ